MGRTRSIPQRFRRAAVIFAAVAGIAWMLIPVPDPPFPDSYGSVVLDHHGDVLHTYLAEDEQWRFRPDVGDYSEKLEAAVLMAEDRRFRRHPGVDLWSLARAVVQNLQAGEVRSGASTITMQVARLMRPKPRTIPNKMLEMLQALKLESRYSKDELLRMYLGHAPYGGNVVGATAASLHYFGRPPNRLTWAEAATLAVLPRSPSRVTPFRNAQVLIERRRRVAADPGSRRGHRWRDLAREPSRNATRSAPRDAGIGSSPGESGRSRIAWAEGANHR